MVIFNSLIMVDNIGITQKRERKICVCHFRSKLPSDCQQQR